MFHRKNTGVFYLVYEGEGDAPRTFTQDEVNAMMADNKRSMRTKIEELEAKLTSYTTVEEEKQRIQKDFTKFKEENETKHHTEVEQLKKDLTETQKKQEAAANAAALWQTKFQDMLKNNKILDAAAKHDAYNPSQILGLLRDITVVEPILDAEGKDTGEFSVFTAYKTKNDKQEEITLKLAPEEVLKRLKDDEAYANLFKANLVSGLGKKNAGGSEKISLTDLAKDPAKYREYREKQKEGKK